jgi:hypothetical protein
VCALSQAEDQGALPDCLRARINSLTFQVSPVYLLPHTSSVSQCDGKVPACSNCFAAGKECLGVSGRPHADGSHVPRSLIHCLETRVAAIESHLSQQGIDPDKAAASASAKSAASGSIYQQTPVYDYRVDTDPVAKRRVDDFHNVKSIISDFTHPSVGITENMLFATFVVGGSSVPTVQPSSPDSVAGNLPPSSRSQPSHDLGSAQDQSIFSSVLSGSLSANFDLIPQSVADFLVRNYVDRILPQYPFFHEREVQDCYNTVFSKRLNGDSANGTRAATPYDAFVVGLIMAISLTTAAQANHARAITTSEARFFAM